MHHAPAWNASLRPSDAYVSLDAAGLLVRVCLPTVKLTKTLLTKASERITKLQNGAQRTRLSHSVDNMRNPRHPEFVNPSIPWDFCYGRVFYFNEIRQGRHQGRQGRDLECL